MASLALAKSGNIRSKALGSPRRSLNFSFRAVSAEGGVGGGLGLGWNFLELENFHGKEGRKEFSFFGLRRVSE